MVELKSKGHSLRGLSDAVVQGVVPHMAIRCLFKPHKSSGWSRLQRVTVVTANIIIFISYSSITEPEAREKMI